MRRGAKSPKRVKGVKMKINNKSALDVTNEVISKLYAVGVKLDLDAKYDLYKAVKGFATIHGMIGEKLFKAAMITAYSLNETSRKEVA